MVAQSLAHNRRMDALSSPPAPLSWRARAFIGLLHAIRRRRIYASVEGLMAGIAQVRRAGPARPSRAWLQRVDGSCEHVDGHEVYTVRPRAASSRVASAPAVVYLHGGAYVRPITAFHWALIGHLVDAVGAEVTVPLYPLAPEHHGRTALDMVCAVWAQVSRQPVERPLVLMGDSAGGGLALALAAALRDAGAPRQPDRLGLITPWVDVTVPHPLAAQTARQDPMLALPGAREAGRLYAGPLSVTDPVISPLQGRLDGLPPMAMWVATRDLLCHDALDLAARVQAAGGEASVHMGRGLPHVWPLLPIPEGRQARGGISRWVDAARPMLTSTVSRG